MGMSVRVMDQTEPEIARWRDAGSVREGRQAFRCRREKGTVSPHRLPIGTIHRGSTISTFCISHPALHFQTEPLRLYFSVMSSSIDLDAYCNRIQYSGDRPATLETLREFHLRHAHTIPFENLNPLLGLPVRLDITSLQEKLIHKGR